MNTRVVQALAVGAVAAGLIVASATSIGANSSPTTARSHARAVAAAKPSTRPSIAVGEGAHITRPNCTSKWCAWITLNASGLRPNDTYKVACRTDYPDGGEAFAAYRITTDSRGRYRSSSGHCYYGYPGHQVWLTVGQLSSNHYFWH